MSRDFQREELHPAPRGIWLTISVSLLISFAAGAAWSARAWPLPYGGRTLGTIMQVKTVPLPLHPLTLPTVGYAVGGRSYQAAAALPNVLDLRVGDSMEIDYAPARPGQAVPAYEADALVTNLVVVIIFCAGALLFNFVQPKARILESQEALGVDRALK